MENGEAKLDVSIGAKDIVHIEIGGYLTASNMPKLTEWTTKVKETIQDLFHKNSKKILCLVDISSVEKYDPEVITRLAELMKDNEPYVKKTATFGGGSYLVMAEDVIIALSGRKNLKAFKNKDEAMDWLLEM